MSFIQEYAIGQFGKKVVNKLAKKGIALNSVGVAPDSNGGFANGTTIYFVDNKGTCQGYTYLQILELAK